MNGWCYNFILYIYTWPQTVFQAYPTITDNYCHFCTNKNLNCHAIIQPLNISEKKKLNCLPFLILNFQFGLRQLDLSLLSQLWALNESIQEFRTIIQEQDELSPESPSPSPSDTNSISSSDEGDNHIGTIQQYQPLNQTQQPQQQQRMRSAPPPPPPSRKAPARPVWSCATNCVLSKMQFLFKSPSFCKMFESKKNNGSTNKNKDCK